MRPMFLLPLLLSLAALHSTTPAHASWPSTNSASVPLCSDCLLASHPVAASDGLGGAVVFALDSVPPVNNGTGFGLSAHRVRVDGTRAPGWPANGVPACPTAQTIGVVAAADDGAGGAYAAWTDWRSGAYELRAQHVRPDGAVDPAWPDSGWAFCPAAVFPGSLKAAPDGEGGLFVWWSDQRDTDNHGIMIVLQRLKPNGTIADGWPTEGVMAGSYVGGTTTALLVPDGNGGALMAYNWGGSFTTTTGLQHILGDGTIDPAWPEEGLTLLADSAAVFSWPQIATDGAGGMLVSWIDLRDEQNDPALYATRILGNGQVAPGWSSGGTLVHRSPWFTYTGGGGYLAPVVCGDGEGGLMLVWHDGRSMTGSAPYAQHVLANGQLDARWPVGGLDLTSVGLVSDEPSIRPDGSGGVYIAGADGRSGFSDIYMQRLRADGTVASGWPVNGALVRTEMGHHFNPVVLPTSPAGVLVAWVDLFNGVVGTSVQRVNPNGSLGDPVTGVTPAAPRATLSLSAPQPSPASHASTLRFALSRAADARLEVLDAAGRRVRALASGAMTAGEHSVSWDLRDAAGAAVRPGWYVVRLTSDGQSESHPIVVRR